MSYDPTSSERLRLVIDELVALNPDSAWDFPAWQRMAVLGHSFEKRIN
jgi:hypothetical protein